MELFTDQELVTRIKARLPHLFHLAELDSSRAGKVGMEVGIIREKILVALLIYKFGEKNIETQIPTTETEVDVRLFGQPISIKTITGLGGVKVIWTVDAQKSQEFLKNYNPACDMLLATINWQRMGGLYYIPVDVQRKIFANMGKVYLKLPKVGTNPRGVEISKDALQSLMGNGNTQSIKISWQHSKVEYDPYKRWVDYWKTDDWRI